MIKDAVTLSPELEASAQSWRDLLGLHDWQIVFRYPEDNDELEDGIMGNVRINADYLEAIITLRPNRPFLDTCETILHEMLHITIAPLTNHIDHLMMHYVPKQATMMLYSAKKTLEEQVVTRTQRALFQSIRPTEIA